MKVKSESEVAQSCLTLSDPMDCSLPGSSVHGIFQARILEWGAIALAIALPVLMQLKFFVMFYMFHCLVEIVAVVVEVIMPPAATEIIITLPLSDFLEQESVSAMSECFTS